MLLTTEVILRRLASALAVCLSQALWLHSLLPQLCPIQNTFSKFIKNIANKKLMYVIHFTPSRGISMRFYQRFCNKYKRNINKYEKVLNFLPGQVLVLGS